MVDEPRRHVHDQDVGEARFLKAGDAREKKSGAILVRPFVKVDLGNVHLGKHELNGMDVEAEVEQNDELELSSGSLHEELVTPRGGFRRRGDPGRHGLRIKEKFVWYP